ncbi:Ankyrin repeats (3 copies) [compost metagenome]
MGILLLRAIEQEDLGRIKKHLDRGANPNKLTPNGTPEFFYAFEKGNLDIIELFLQYRLNLNLVDQSGANILNRVIRTLKRSEHLETIVRLILVAGFDLNAPVTSTSVANFPINTAFDQLVFIQGATEFMHLFLEFGAKLQSDSEYMSVFGHKVLASNLVSNIDLLPDITWTETHLMTAIKNNVPMEVLVYLKNACEEITNPSKIIDEAIKENNLAFLQYFMDYEMRKTAPVIRAATLGMIDILKYFVQSGADINYRDHLGNTALITCARERPYMVEVICNFAETDVHIINNNGSTALDTVLTFGINSKPYNAVAALVRKGATSDKLLGLEKQLPGITEFIKSKT